VKNLLKQNNSFMGYGSSNFDKIKSPMSNAGPKFGHSKLGISCDRSNYSGTGSN